jgi:hypothetical protein
MRGRFGEGECAYRSLSLQPTTWVTCGCRLGRGAVIFAAVVLLFAGRYPQSIYDFVLGKNRRALRVGPWQEPTKRHSWVLWTSAPKIIYR